MDRERFESLVSSLEARAGKSPRGFLVQTGALALFGYAYIVGVLVVMLSLCGVAIWLVVHKPSAATIKLGWLLVATAGVVAWSIARSLWIRLEPPEGMPLERAEFPALFALIDRIRGELRCPPFHRVLLNGEHNACVAQIPRLGILGWHRNYLVIGLPLLLGLSVEEFTAVLAHEFGHLAGSHGRFGNWLYRLRQTWARTFDAMSQQAPGMAALPLTAFLKWFWPRFNARAFVLSRTNEYEADRYAAQLAGAENAASALIRINVQSAYLEERFWPGIRQLAGSTPSPIENLLERQAAGLASVQDLPEHSRWLRASLLVPTGTSNTHPCLRERLQGLGSLPRDATPGDFPAALPALPPVTAAESLLGNQLANASSRLNSEWAEAIKPAWQARHQEIAGLRESLASLGADAALAEVDQLWKQAELTIQIEGDAAAQPALEELLRRHPDHAGACFVRGRHLLASDDPAGVELLEKAIAADSGAAGTVLSMLREHFARTGQEDRRREMERRLDGLQAESEAAGVERAQIRARDTFIPSGLSAEQIEAIRNGIKDEPGVVTVDIVRKAVVHLPTSPCYVIAIGLNTRWWRPRRPAVEQRIVNRVVACLPLEGNLFVFVAAGDNRSIAKAVRKVDGARVHPR